MIINLRYDSRRIFYVFYQIKYNPRTLYLIVILDPSTETENSAGDPIFSSFQTLQDVIRWFVEKIRKFFNFVPFYGTLCYWGYLVYTQKSTIGQNNQKIQRKNIKTWEKPCATSPKLSRTSLPMAWNVFVTLWGSKIFYTYIFLQNHCI